MEGAGDMHQGRGTDAGVGLRDRVRETGRHDG